MKVLHAIDTLNVGGAEKIFVILTSLLSEQDITTHALLLNHAGGLIKELNPNVTLHVLNRRNKFSIKKLKLAHELCAQYDIVHAHLRHVHAYIKLARLLFGGRYKLILHDHSSSPLHSKPFRLKGIFKPSHYIGINNKMTNDAKRYLSINNCYTLPNAIVPDTSIRYHYPNNNQALIIGNIREVKQLPLAMKIANNAGLALTIYGNRQEQKYFDTIQQLAKLSGTKIKEGVTDFSNIYGNYSIALHTSSSESGPLVLLEYLAYGIPFLAYNTGSVAEVLADELPLHFIDSFDPEQWAERIGLIRKQGDISETLKAVFEKNFSANDYLQQCLKIYESVDY